MVKCAIGVESKIIRKHCNHPQISIYISSIPEAPERRGMSAYFIFENNREYTLSNVDIEIKCKMFKLYNLNVNKAMVICKICKTAAGHLEAECYAVFAV